MTVISLAIMAADDPNGSALCTLTDADVSSFEMRVAENELGGGKFTIRRDHALATAANLAAGNYVKVTIPVIDAQPVFGFWLDEHNDTILSRTEEGGEFLTRAGPGTLAILGRAALLDQFYNGSLGGEARGNYDVAGSWTWSSEPYGAILVRLIEEGQLEPGTPLADVTIDFVRTLDSDGDAWPDIEELIQVPIGTDGLSLYERLIASGNLFVRADPDLAIHGYGTPPGTDRTSGSFGAGKVRFVKGVNIETELVRQGRGVQSATHAIVVGKDHVYRKVVSPNYSSGAGRWVSVDYQASNDPDLLDDVGLEDLRRRESLMDTIEMEILPGDAEGSGLYLPFKHFDTGDLVTVHTGSDPWDYNEYEGRMAGFRLVLGPASRDGTDLEKARSLRVIVEVNGSHTVGFTGHQDSGGCCPPGVPYTPIDTGTNTIACGTVLATGGVGVATAAYGLNMAVKINRNQVQAGDVWSAELSILLPDDGDGGYSYVVGFALDTTPTPTFTYQPFLPRAIQGSGDTTPPEVSLTPSTEYGLQVASFTGYTWTQEMLDDWDGLYADEAYLAVQFATSPTIATAGGEGYICVTVTAGPSFRASSQPSLNQVTHEAIPGTTAGGTLTTNYQHVPSSLIVYVSGVRVPPSTQDPTTGEFTLPIDTTGLTVVVHYQVANPTDPTGEGNPNTMPTGTTAIPHQLLGTGGDGSGDNVLRDDGTWGTATAVMALDDLTDVALTSVVAGQRLRFNGTNWVNAFTRFEPHVDYTGSVVIDGSGNPVMVEVLS